jgi:hypothetical protein
MAKANEGKRQNKNASEWMNVLPNSIQVGTEKPEQGNRI